MSRSHSRSKNIMERARWVSVSLVLCVPCPAVSRVRGLMSTTPVQELRASSRRLPG